MSTAVYIGRFQPFHIGHLDVCKYALSKFDRLLILIGSAQESGTEKNPLSADTRLRVIQNTLEDDCMSDRVFFAKVEDCIDDKIWAENIRRAVNDARRYLEDVNYLLWPSKGSTWSPKGLLPYPIHEYPCQVQLSASDIRERWKTMQPWTHLVPHDSWKVYVK